MGSRPLPRSFAAALLTIVTLLACGSDDGPRMASLVTPTEAGAAGFGSTPSTMTCGTLADGTACACIDVPLVLDPPTLYFVLDRSGSVSSELWTAMRVAVGDVMRSLGPRARFGAAVVPSPESKGCGVGREIFPPTLGDYPTPGADGKVTANLLAVTASMPPAEGGTPLSPTLAALRARLAAEPHAAVILATDGAPNCNAGARCEADRCLLNLESYGGCSPRSPSCCTAPNGSPESCVDDEATRTEIAALRALAIPTYVLGAPGSEGYAAVLGALARAGGTAREGASAYYPVGHSTELGAALRAIAGKASGTCSFTLATPPDPAQLNVLLDGRPLPPAPARDGGTDAGGEPDDGWRLEGATVTLVGEPCAQVLRGDALSVRILAGCPTVVR